MNKILIINTGGTLSCDCDKSTASDRYSSGLSPVLSCNEILKAIKEIFNNLEFEAEDLFSVDSADIIPENWALLAKRISASCESYCGIVIIHGTDTLAYTSSMLFLMLRGIQIPVVITGSQKPLRDPETDALFNLQGSINMAASGHAGIFVCFGGKIMLGNKVSKVRSKSFNAFESIGYPDVGKFNSNGIDISPELLPKREENFNPRFDFTDKVFLLKMFPGISSEIMDWLVNSGYRGVYIESFGLGGIPSYFAGAIKKATDRGLAVLIGTQVPFEGSDLTLYETGKRALRAGAAETKNMTTEAALTELMWNPVQINDKR